MITSFIVCIYWSRLRLKLICMLPSPVTPNRIQIVTETGGPASPTCLKQATYLRNIITAFPQVPGWRYLVVCEEHTWDTLLRGLHHEPAPSHITYATTDLVSRTIYFRGPNLLHPGKGEPDGTYVIAHELAHAYLGESERNTEENADQLARSWIEDRRTLLRDAIKP